MKSHSLSVAGAYLRALKSRGVDWIFGNAGTDFAPIIEAIAANDEDIDALPRTVEYFTRPSQWRWRTAIT